MSLQVLCLTQDLCPLNLLETLLKTDFTKFNMELDVSLTRKCIAVKSPLSSPFENDHILA